MRSDMVGMLVASRAGGQGGTGLLLVVRTGTFNSLITTQEFAGKSCIIVTRNCRQPLQWPMSSMRQIRLKILMKTSATSRN